MVVPEAVLQASEIYDDQRTKMENLKVFRKFVYK